MRSRTLAFLPLTLLALAGCPTPPSPDASDGARPDVPEAGPMDAEPADGGDDAPDAPPPPPPSTCMPCLYDRECGEGGACVVVDPMRLPVTRQCLVACANEGAACDANGLMGTCRTGTEGGPFCYPPAGGCTASRANAACSSAMPCTGRYNLCVAPAAGAPTVCLARCTRDSDCDNNYARCRDVTGGPPGVRACVPDDVIGPERCGARAVNTRGIGAPCSASSGPACATGLACLEGLDPAVTHGFCSASCARDEECGGGDARCLPVGTMGNRCVPRDCECVAGPRDTLLDRALAAGSWSRCKLYFTRDYIDVFGNDVTRDRFRMPVFDRVHRDWMAGAAWPRAMGPALDARATSLSGLIASAGGLRATGGVGDVPVAPVVGAPASDAPLAEATALLIEAYGGTADRAALRMDAADVPAPLQRAAAAVVVAITRAAQARDRGLVATTSPDDLGSLYALATSMVLASSQGSLDPADPLTLGVILGDVELPVPEATALAATIEATDWSAFRGQMGPSFDAPTPIGRIVVRDGAAHTYAPDMYPATALVLDLGGDDTYQAPVGANASVDNRVSVLIDLAGADHYGYVERPVALDNLAAPDPAQRLLPSDGRGRYNSRAQPFSLSDTSRQGAGRLGVALLYDLGAGADSYRSLRASQGFGALGIGGLYDDGGDDTYDMESGGQGAGILGIGVMLDAAGDDHYTLWTNGQGFGYVRSVGVLYDRDGADEYTAKLSPVVSPSPQDTTVNSSMAQGVGFGRRADTAMDRTNMSGGIGVLRDRAGNDRYTVAIFGQATGYWGGMGLLLDGAGDDTYNGRWYVQAGTAHFAYAALVDGCGRDVHNADAVRQNMTAGAGHDFSVSFFLADGNDDDTYHVPNLALGAGNANGAGFFVEAGGSDTYDAASTLTCGNAAYESLTDMGRLARPVVGVFLDGAGTDSYTRAPSTDPVRNDATWTQRVHPEAMNETGLGADGSGAALGM